jgi:hypothetical protein
MPNRPPKKPSAAPRLSIINSSGRAIGGIGGVAVQGMPMVLVAVNCINGCKNNSFINNWHE